MSRWYPDELGNASTESATAEPRAGNGDAMPFLHELPQTMQALRALVRDAGTRSTVRPGRHRADGGQHDLSGFALTRLLHSYGLTLRRSAFAGSPDESTVVASGIGFPVNLKLISPALADRHQAEGMAVDLANAKAVRKAAERMVDELRDRDEEAAVDGFIVQETAAGVEIIVGVALDPVHGPFMVAGLGNSAREASRDMAIRLLPVDEQAATEMLRSLMDSCEQVPDRNRFDIAALASVMVGLSRFFLDYRPWLAGVEIAPLIAPGDGKEARVGNVRIVWAEPPVPRRKTVRAPSGKGRAVSRGAQASDAT